MVVELISVGTEILMGNITNTNAGYLAQKCADLGLECYYQVTVGDNAKRLEQTVKTALKRSDIIIMTGGLGPTEDDLTKETVASVLKKKLVLDEHSKACITAYFKRIQRKDITENNWKQAYIPEGAIVVDNHNGTAPGIIIQTDDEPKKNILLIPGPPNELYPMFENDMMPYLASLSAQMLVSETVKIAGRGESWVAAEISDLIDKQTNPTIAPYAKTGEVHLRVTAEAEDEASAKKLLKPVVKEFKKRFPKDVYTTDEHVQLEDHLVALLKAHHLSITTAESCTGGLVAGRIVNVPGASEVLNQAIVTYANKAKMKMLGVSKKTLKKHGAVSKKTAKDMAKGAAKFAKADVAIAITGSAGPDGGTKEKPVGLVYIGCYVDGDVTVKECHFTGNREKVRDYAVVTSLDLARRCIMERFGEKRVDEK